MILDDELMDRIAHAKDAGSYLILDEDPEQPGQWVVQCLDQKFRLDFTGLINNKNNLAPSSLKNFLAKAEELKYQVVFTEDPESILEVYEKLNAEPSVELISSLDGTIKGFLPYQVQGFNYLKDLDAGVAMWSTGTGKTVLAAGLLKYHLQLADFDIAWVVVKAHNKVNVQRTLNRLANVNAMVLDGPQKRREEALINLLEAPSGTVVITNYEKFRIDQTHMLPLFDKRVLLIWDEMPTKLKSRQTKLYRSIRKLLYKKNSLELPRPTSLRQYMLSATPIENNPEDFYNCVRLLDPKVYGPITDFRNRYVQSYNPFSWEPAVWKDLSHMGQVAAHMTHQVDKSSPDIAAQFPKVIQEPYYIDWDKQNQKIYGLLKEEAKKKIGERNHFDEEGVFGFLAVMQMLCDAPSMVSNSAALREAYELGQILGENPAKRGSKVAMELQKILTRRLVDDGHPKLETLRQLLVEEHPKEKVVIFTSYAETLLPILAENLETWEVPYVVYSGNNHDKQRAQDYFQYENFVRVFLSSDRGSDSISLEQASVVVHYDLPWKWSTYIQRQNRIHRVISEHKAVRYYTLMMADSIEERKLRILEKKEKFHQEVFKGEISNQSESARLSKDDLLYILGT